MSDKPKPMILLNFRGVRISKSLDTVQQFKKCLDFLFDEEDYIQSIIDSIEENVRINKEDNTND